MELQIARWGMRIAESLFNLSIYPRIHLPGIEYLAGLVGVFIRKNNPSGIEYLASLLMERGTG